MDAEYKIFETVVNATESLYKANYGSQYKKKEKK